MEQTPTKTTKSSEFGLTVEHEALHHVTIKATAKDGARIEEVKVYDVDETRAAKRVVETYILASQLLAAALAESVAE